jgi:hypothetical protein
VGRDKRTVALIVALLALGAIFALLGSASAAPGGSASARVTIRTWPKGVYGYVDSSAAKCADGRKVALFEQAGDTPDPAVDRRVASVRSNGESGAWAVRTQASGPLYAAVAKAPGCAADHSDAVASLLQAGDNGQGADFPSCSPYLSETPASICKLDQIYAKLDQEGVFKSCVFTRGSGGCPGKSKRGSFPWCCTNVQFNWNWGNHSVHFFSDRVGALMGTMPGPGSADFTVTDGFASGEPGPSPDRFYTPDLPGAAAGEVGGPLKVNFVGGSWDETGAEIYIDGYLYLRQ